MTLIIIVKSGVKKKVGINIKIAKNENEKKIASLRDDLEKGNVKDLEKEQTRNVYVNTFYFAVLSIAFGITYFFFIG